MKMCKSILFLFFIFLEVISDAQQLPFRNDYAFGLDVSFVKQREDRGEKYMDSDSTVKPSLQIFREHGFNWGRIMICNEPITSRLPQNIGYVVSAALDLKKYGYRFLLDYMFSNGWANPMVQPTPSAWRNMAHNERIKAVYNYTRETMTALKEAGAMPDMVQVGNEIGNGFLWPDGRIRYDSLKTARWKNMTDYLAAAIRAIRDTENKDHKVKVMLHVDHGGDLEMTKTFFDKMRDYKVDYDVMGFSFYPWSHGTLMDLRDNLAFAAGEYGKEIIVVETGYYFRTSDYFRNMLAPVPETPQGQSDWLAAVNQAVMDVPGGLGRGVFWWEPMMRGRGFFDDNRVILPIVHAPGKYALPLQRADGYKRIQ